MTTLLVYFLWLRGAGALAVLLVVGLAAHALGRWSARHLLR